MSEKVILIDAGTGNLRSVWNALNSLGCQVTLTADPKVVSEGSRLILPGVGAFGAFMHGLRSSGMAQAVCEAAERGIPLLGICVGMQAFFEVGLEGGSHAGLALLPGRVEKFNLSNGWKVPHTGWNQVQFDDCALFKGLQPGCHVYFNHSYYCKPQEAGIVCARTSYGTDFCSAVMSANLCGVQFHPEKSQRVGLTILKNFLSL